MWLARIRELAGIEGDSEPLYISDVQWRGRAVQVDYYWWWVGDRTAALVRDPQPRGAADAPVCLEVWQVASQSLTGLGLALPGRRWEDRTLLSGWPRLDLEIAPESQLLHSWEGVDAVQVGLDLLDERAGEWL